VIYQRSSVYREQNVNAALAGAKGDYIKPLFDDDLLHPFCIERMVAAMQPRPKWSWCSRPRRSSTPTTSASKRAARMKPAAPVRPRRAPPRYARHGKLHRRIHHRDVPPPDHVGHRPAPLFKMGDHDFLTGLADLIAYLNLTKNASMFYIDEELTYFRKDLRLQSNSNPTSNPFFGNCFSDYIDLLRVSLDAEAINADEYRSMHPQVDAVFLRLNNLFPQVGEARERYLAKLAKLDQ
jgi:glycosyltransferase involved in cell wall biosynthesis